MNESKRAGLTWDQIWDAIYPCLSAYPSPVSGYDEAADAVWALLSEEPAYPRLDSCGVCTLHVYREHKRSCPAHRECNECDNQLEHGEIGICAECVVRTVEEMP